jgi:tetratricopeptide (TPR) repeat protein
METYTLNSRIVEDNKEFLVQTINDIGKGIIRTSIFVDGEFIDADILPHEENIDDDQILSLVKAAHGERKSELEYLLKNYREIMDSGTPEMMFHLGKALFYRRIIPEAVKLFDSAVKFRDDYHEAYFYLSQAEMSLGNHDKAVAAGINAVRIKPSFADYRNNLGEAYLGSNQCRKAADEFEAAVKQNVYYADAYFNLGIAYILNATTRADHDMWKDYKSRALDYLNKAVLIYPFFKTSLYDEAIANLGNDNCEKALGLLGKVRSEKKDRLCQEKASRFHRFNLYGDWLTRNNISDRMADIEKEIEKNPSYVDLYYEMAICNLYHAKLSWREAVEYFEKTLKINPDLNKARRGAELGKDFLARMADAVHDIAEKSNR